VKEESRGPKAVNVEVKEESPLPHNKLYDFSLKGKKTPIGVLLFSRRFIPYIKAGDFSLRCVKIFTAYVTMQQCAFLRIMLNHNYLYKSIKE